MLQRRARRGRALLRLVFPPALIALAVTLLRLAGELGHWSQRWFSSETGGIVPAGVSWLFGITWLAVPFGAYFALKLTRRGEGPRRPWRAVVWSAAGLAVVFVALRLVWRLPIPFPPILVLVWLTMVAGAALAWAAWPPLGRTLTVYGLASRLPVVVVMLLAMRGTWGTHYDYVGVPFALQLDFWPRFLWLALFPQIVFWVAFTVLLGSIAGGLAVALFMRPRLA